MKLLLVFYAFQVKVIGLSMATMMSVTADVLEKYHTTCLYILQSTPYPDYYALQRDMEYMKSLIKWKNLQIAIIFMKTLLDKHEQGKCNENLPFFLIMSSEESVRTYLSKFSERSIFPSGRWLMFLPMDVQIDSYFLDIDIPYNCEFTVVQNTPEKSYSLTEIYRQQPHQSLEKHILGKWTDKHLQWTNLSLLERRKNLQEEEEFVLSNCSGFQKEEFCNKYYEIWSIMQKQTNSTSEYVMYSYDEEYEAGNVNWSTAIGTLVSNQADVGLYSYGMTAERIRVVNYISNAFPTKVTTFIKRQRAGFSKWDHILEPFSTSLWWTICFSLVTLPIILTNTWYVTVRYGISPRDEDYSFSNTWLLAIGCFCQQGQETTPKAWSCRLVFLTAYLTYLILIAAYSAIFISFLAVQHYYVPFTDFQGLLDTGTYRLGTYKGALYVGMFEFATNPAMRTIYEKMLVPDFDLLPEEEEEALRKICKDSNYAFAMNSDALEEVVPSCDVMEIPGASFYLAGSLIISKTCPYHRIFNHHMENLRRFGILEKLGNLHGRPEDVDPPNTQATMGDVISMFIILIGGIILSLICLALELVVSKYEYRP
ncbi:Ionotropic receptor 167 [Blattella germanica]|nr:Ionotropic receptor 167 [Blattella germanica]